MNLLHMKYAVEIAEAKSITKAAEKLYTTQPNVSRAIKELENSLGITIFKRTQTGIVTTPEGEEFLGYARSILSQVDAVESLYNGGDRKSLKFSISVPRASYISCAFAEFVKGLDPAENQEIFYRETNALRAVNNILNSDYHLGIIRYQSIFDDNFNEMFDQKGLTAQLVFDFEELLLMSAEHPLASKENIVLSDLTPYTEILHADPFVPSMPLSIIKKNEFSDDIGKRIYVFERGSQMELLSQSHDTFIWVSPVPQQLLDRYSLVQRSCCDNRKRYKDVLIYKNGYALTAEDKSFIDNLVKVKREIEQLSIK